MASEADVLELLQQQINALKESRQQQVQLDAAKAAKEDRLRVAAIKNAQGLVKLNVGGHKYTTSLTTLTAVPESYFTALFSGDWQLAQTAEGEVFVDRDGEVFKHVLGYLRAVRDEQAFKPAAGLTQEAVAAFAAEAQFYGLQELHHRLLHHQFSTPFKYMFVVVNNAWDGPRCYSNVQDPQRARWGFHEPVNLDTLQAEGWEYVCSHAPAGSTSGLAFIIVLRQQV